MQVARDHLVGLADLDHVVDACELARTGSPGIATGVADEADHRVHGAARDERLATGVPHLLADDLDVRVRRVLLHDDDHLSTSLRLARWTAPGTRKPRVSDPGPLSLAAAGDYPGPRPK